MALSMDPLCQIEIDSCRHPMYLHKCPEQHATETSVEHLVCSSPGPQAMIGAVA